jgi:hypothetical protein
MQRISIIIILIFSYNSYANEAVYDQFLNMTLKANQVTNEANQLKQIQQYIQIATETANTVKNTADIKANTLASLEALTGNLLFSKSLTPFLADAEENMAQSYSLKEKIIDGRKLTPENIVDIKILYQDLYGNSIRERELKKPLVYRHVSDSQEDALSYIEYIINSSKERMEEINKTIIQSDRTKSIKDSQDLTNKILSLISLNAEETKLMHAKYARYNLIKNYKGVANGSVKIRKKTRIEREEDKEGSIFRKKALMPKSDGRESFWNR